MSAWSRRLASLRKREERLVRLFSYDEVDNEVERSEFRHVGQALTEKNHMIKRTTRERRARLYQR